MHESERCPRPLLVRLLRQAVNARVPRWLKLTLKVFVHVSLRAGVVRSCSEVTAADQNTNASLNLTPPQTLSPLCVHKQWRTRSKGPRQSKSRSCLSCLHTDMLVQRAVVYCLLLLTNLHKGFEKWFMLTYRKHVFEKFIPTFRKLRVHSSNCSSRRLLFVTQIEQNCLSPCHRNLGNRSKNGGKKTPNFVNFSTL